jgi:eukaryotic-like serine/threonine-protein kinase
MSEDPSKHLTTDELRALSLGRLTDAELAHLSAHLGDCAECCRRIDQLAATDPLVARLQQGAAEGEVTLVSSAQRRSAVGALSRGHSTRATGPRTGPEAESVIRPAPKQIGDYEILAEAGRGGMGVVYKARHRGLQRLAAVKMVLSGEFASPAQEVRFRLEAELAARVQHPNIVHVYEIGSYEGRPFLALEWIDGGSLANRLDGDPWSPLEAASLVETLARAIHVAHTEGVVHRDLKPANVLLQQDERAKMKVEGISSGTEFIPHLSSRIFPKITDFGLAQGTEGSLTLTQSGILVGTPGYMAPEQAGGSERRAVVGPAADIHALGVILYQLITGQMPFQGDSALEVLRAVTSDEPVRPRRLQPRLPRDLEAITLHCMQKEPNRRYPSALALAEDLQRFRERKQVAARPVGSSARLARACRRRPLVALLLGLLTTSFFGGMAGVAWKWLEANEQRDLAKANARQANAEKREALFQLYRARLAAAAVAISAHDVVDAARQLDEAPQALRGWEWQHLRSRLDLSTSVFPLPARAAGLLLPTRDHLRVGIVSGAGLSVTDLDGGEPAQVPLPAGMMALGGASQTRLGLRVAVWVDSRTFCLLDEKGRSLCRVDHPWGGGPRWVIVSPDGSRLATENIGNGWHGVRVFDAASGKQTASCKGPGSDLWSWAFSADGKLFSAGREDGTASIWDAATGSLLATCRGHANKVLGVSFSPDGTRLLSTSSDGTVRQWAVATGREVEPPYDRHSGDVTAAVYSPDGRWVASAGTDRTVRVWQGTGRQEVAVLHGHTGPVAGLAFAPGGRRLASVSHPTRLVGEAVDGTVRVWEVGPRATLPVLLGHGSYVYPVAYSPDGRWIASGDWDNRLRLWDARTGEACAILDNGDLVKTLAFSPDSSRVVSARQDRLQVWEVATGRRVQEIQVPAPNILAVAFHPDGATLAALDGSGGSGGVTVLNAATGALVARLRVSARHDTKALAYSPDGRWLAGVGTDDKTVCLFDAHTYQPSAQFPGHDGRVRAVTFSLDSRRVASCSSDHTVRVWQIDGGACQVLRGHTDDVFAVAFHPDGTRLASAGRDRAVWLWDLARGEEVARLQGHTNYVWSLAFCPDGTTLASGSGDRTVRLWDTAPLRTRYQARHEAEALRPEAERLVEAVWRQKNDAAGVVEALRADRALSEPLRQAALHAVPRRALPPEAAPGNPPDPP